jgi:DNA invertase Pin-like site-specific DNA recombinase
LNVLLSFAQFERELAGERIRDKFAASRRKGMWMGGTIPLGYEAKDPDGRSDGAITDDDWHRARPSPWDGAPPTTAHAASA